MKLIELEILLATLFSLSTSRTYSYSPELKTTTFYTCYSQTGSDRVIIDIKYNETIVQDYDITNFNNAFNACLKVETAIHPISDDMILTGNWTLWPIIILRLFK